jgi:hypothetical protein
MDKLEALASVSRVSTYASIHVCAWLTTAQLSENVVRVLGQVSAIQCTSYVAKVLSAIPCLESREIHPSRYLEPRCCSEFEF